MELRLESNDIRDYLREIPPIVRFDTPLIREAIETIESQASTPREKAKKSI